MEINITTPALLFPAISLLLLAYTNRFLALAALIRELHSKYKSSPHDLIMGQIKNLRKRIILIRDMQGFGAGSLFICVLSMLLFYMGNNTYGTYLFGISLVLMMTSLGFSLREIKISIDALNLHLSDLEHEAEDSGKIQKT